LAQEKSGPIGRRRDREGACPSRGTGCGGHSTKWRPVVRQGCMGRIGPMSERRRGAMR